MLTFERTRDAELIRGVITHPAVFPFMFSDGGPSAADYAPPIAEHIAYNAVRIDGTLAGIFICQPQTAVCWEVHICLLPHARRGASDIYRAGCEWLGKQTNCRKVIGNIPASNRAALLVALAAGAEVIGKNTGSILKNGRLEDQTIVGKAL